MDLKRALEKEHSRANTSQIISYIGLSDDKFKVLFDLFINGSDTLKQRSAWVVGDIGVEQPSMIKPYLKRLINNLGAQHHNAIYRNTFRVLQEINIPTPLQGEAVEYAFDFLTRQAVPVAIKSCAMSTIYNISRDNPELKPELKLIIEDQMPYASTGFKGRGAKIIAKLNKEITG